MKPTFLNQNRPIVTAMIQQPTIDESIYLAKNAIYDGADALGFQNESLEFGERTEENYRRLFAEMGTRPIYVTNYHRFGLNAGKLTYDECMDGLIDMLKYGATLADVMGDTYDESPLELTRNEKAIDKQMRLIEKIHSMDKEVLMSSHVMKFIPAEQVLEIAYEHQRRGADISKIVTAANSDEEQVENLRITALLKKELKIPFLFLSNGTHYKLHRLAGPMLGSVMYLCVHRYGPHTSPSQPPVKSIRAVLDNVDYMPTENFGTI